MYLRIDDVSDTLASKVSIAVKLPKWWVPQKPSFPINKVVSPNPKTKIDNVIDRSRPTCTWKNQSDGNIQAEHPPTKDLH